MKTNDIQNVVELLKIAKIGVSEQEEKEKRELKDLEANEFTLLGNMEEVLPIISVDGSYSFLFSFLGAETWIVLFRIAVTEYQIQKINGNIHYTMYSPPKIYDHLNLVSFNEAVLSSQPEVYSIAAEIASGFTERAPQIFASNVMSYFEDKTLENISETRENCILLKDGALLTFSAAKREEIYKKILLNCRMNNIILAGVSKSTTSHTLNDFYTDDYYLKKFYDKRYPNLTYIHIPKEIFERQTKFDVWGDVYFAKLHKEASKWFRIDIDFNIKDKNKLFSSIAAYSMVQLIPGYPIGLIEAHKVAKSVRDLKESYELELLESLSKMGLNAEDILDGAVDMNGKQFGSFHEILDQLAR